MLSPTPLNLIKSHKTKPTAYCPMYFICKYLERYYILSTIYKNYHTTKKFSLNALTRQWSFSYLIHFNLS
jgi:hypothetical protein